MSEIKKIELKKSEEVVDIICNICNQSCKTDEHKIDNELRVDNGETYRIFNSIKIEKHWGYDSDKDGEYWCANICEKCLDEHLSKLIKFDKYEYNLIHGTVNYKKPIKDNDRGV